MVKKVTYSRRQPDKRQSAYDFDDLARETDSRKRVKTVHGPDELRSLTPNLSRQGKEPSVSKKSAFSGPISIPDDADFEPLPKSSNRRSVFDKVLGNGTCKPAKLDDDTIKANRQLFAEITKTGQKPREYNDQKSKRYLPTPPAEVPKKDDHEAQEDEIFAQLNGHADRSKLMTPKTSSASSTPSTRTSQLLERVGNKEPFRASYQPRAYKAGETAAPRRTIDGSLLSRRSRESQLWTANQASSLFLQLPQDVRDLIYRYTLGGKTIHIEYETYRITRDPTRPKVARQVVPVFRYHCTVLDGRMNPYQAAAKPYIKTHKTLTLLNHVCRQLYGETATLPYKLNMMCFGSHNIMVNFLLMEKRLSGRHLDAFTQLLLPDELPGANILASLRNLEKVYLVNGDSERATGWYHVEREEGEEPRLARAPKVRA